MEFQKLGFIAFGHLKEIVSILCKLHHWALEKGLISLDKNYKVIVSKFILERGPTE